MIFGFVGIIHLVAVVFSIVELGLTAYGTVPPRSPILSTLHR